MRATVEWTARGRGSGLSSSLQLHIGGGGAIKMGLLMAVGADGD